MLLVLYFSDLCLPRATTACRETSLRIGIAMKPTWLQIKCSINVFFIANRQPQPASARLMYNPEFKLLISLPANSPKTKGKYPTQR